MGLGYIDDDMYVLLCYFFSSPEKICIFIIPGGVIIWQISGLWIS